MVRTLFKTVSVGLISKLVAFFKLWLSPTITFAVVPNELRGSRAPSQSRSFRTLTFTVIHHIVVAGGPAMLQTLRLGLDTETVIQTMGW